MSLRLLYLILIRVCGWLVLLGRSPASKKAATPGPAPTLRFRPATSKAA